jgi:hypothetical protein
MIKWLDEQGSDVQNYYERKNRERYKSNWLIR